MSKLLMLHPRDSQHLLIYDAVIQGTFCGGEEIPLPTQASLPNFSTSAFFPLQFPGTMKLRGHAVLELTANTTLQCTHLTP